MIIVGMVAIVVKGMMSAGGVVKAFMLAGEHGRLQLFDFTVDPFMRHNTLNFFLGTGFSIVCLYGTHQPQVQRYCSLPTYRHAMKAVFLSFVLKLFTMSLVVLTGIAIYANYAGCDPLLLQEITKYDQIVPHFVVEELSFLPGIILIGMMGLFVSCVFSAVLSSVSSALNSLSAVVWEDFLVRIPLFRNLSPRGQANTTRFVALTFGIICMALAFAAQSMGAIFQATITAVGAFSGPLGAIFLMGLFIPCVNKWGATAGMLTGLITMIFLAIQSFTMEKQPPLPTYIDNCPPETNTSHVSLGFQNVTVAHELEWPEKLYTLSYLLYPFAGGAITVVVGVLVGIVTGGVQQAKKLDKIYLHPILQKCFCCPVQDVHIRKSTYVHADRLSGLYDFHPHASNPNLHYNMKYESVPTKIEEQFKELEKL